MQIRTRELFQSIRTEGGLLPPDLLRRVADADPELQGLTEDSYHLDPGVRLSEVISRGWNRLLGAWSAFDTARRNLPDDDAGGQFTRDRWLHVVFSELGYGRLVSQPAVEIDGKSYPIFTEWQHTPIHMVGCNVGLDRRTSGVRGAAGQSPHSLVQELLNRSPERLWGMVSNGLRLRLVRDNVALTRQAYVEFDLEAMMTGEAYSDFAVLWLLVHQSRVEAERPEECWLECWSKIASDQGARALDALRTGVEEAIVTLGRGFLAHPDNHHLHEALRSGTLKAQDYYRQLLRLVYRLLFLFVAEDRDALLDPAADPRTHERYLRHYSTQRLRRLADRRRGGQQHDLYTALSVVMEHLGSSSCPPLGLPALGSYLWSREALGQLADATVANSELLAAIRNLAWVEERGVRRAVDFRHLGAEELGSVYESLLELHPELDRGTATFTLKTSNGNDRKTTGSYYTPTDLITALLDSALEPVLDEAAKSADPNAAILELTVCDPACGSGHFLIAAANRIGKRLAAIRTDDSEPAPEAMRHALRDVIGSCIYGVDMNPMAVELCKVSLWMEALYPGRPLSFLDDRIVCGNSLLGTTPELIDKGIPANAFKPLLGDIKEVVTELRKRNARERKGQTTLEFTSTVGADTQTLADHSAAITQIPDNSLRGVRERERRFSELVASPELERARLLADTWCGAFVAPKRPGEPTITQDVLLRVATQGAAGLSNEERGLVESLHRVYGFHHWHVAFPAVFAAGGLNVVLGNPPWERVKFQEKEFFDVRVPEIAAAPNKAARGKLIKALSMEDPTLLQVFEDAKREAEGTSHLLRCSGRYPLCGRGDVNTYAVFAELNRTIIGPTGCVGCIVPTGIATDDTTKHFFQEVVDSHTLASLYDFENREKVFPAVDSRMKFCLLTLTGSDRPVRKGAAFIFFATRTEHLGDPERCFTLTAEDIALLNPNTHTCPVFRTRRDAEITKAIYSRVPVLVREGDSSGNPWGLRLTTMFHMSNDSHLFHTREQLELEGWELDGNVFVRDGARMLPLYEAKMADLYDHRRASVVISETAVVRQGQQEYLTKSDHEDPSCVPLPRSWVADQQVNTQIPDPQISWLVVWRNVTSPTNERTMLASVIPRAGVGHSLQVATLDGGAGPLAAVFVGAVSSLVFDFTARVKLGGTNLTFFILRQLPMLSPAVADYPCPWEPSQSVASWVSERVAELIVTARDLVKFARDLGYKEAPFRWDAERRLVLRAELDAAFFYLYGIGRHDVEYILETFPIVRRKDEQTFGEYRTKRVILERYDAMAESATIGRRYETVLDPPPADPRVTHQSRNKLPDGAVDIALPFRRVEDPPEIERYRSIVPIYSLKAAAGTFGAGEAVEPDGWANLDDGPTLRVGMFVAEVTGRSMEPRIPDGAWCLFASPVATGPNNGDILLVENRMISDPDTGGSYTLKRYHSKKVRDGELWENEEITLEPLNPEYEPIVLRPEQDGGVRVIAEFIDIVG